MEKLEKVAVLNLCASTLFENCIFSVVAYG